MGFLKNIEMAMKAAGGAVQGAVETVAEKNRKSAAANRLRTVIRCEEKAAERAFLALGRYYYHNLRDAENSITEPHCVDVEAAQRRIDEAVQKLEVLSRETETACDEEEITLSDVRELGMPDMPFAQEAQPEADVPPEADAPQEGLVDEAIEAAAVQPEAERDASEKLPFEG